MFDKSFQEVLYGIDNEINKGSGWVIELIECLICKYFCFESIIRKHIELPRRLKTSIKGLINIKNNDIKCFL